MVDVVSFMFCVISYKNKRDSPNKIIRQKIDIRKDSAGIN